MVTTVTDKKPSEADDLPQIRNVNHYEDNLLSTVKLLDTDSLPQNSRRCKYETWLRKRDGWDSGVKISSHWSRDGCCPICSIVQSVTRTRNVAN